MPKINYQCGKCGGGFAKLVTITYREYPGAALQKDFVTPCCRTGDYDDFDTSKIPSTMKDIGPEPDPFQGPSGMHCSA